MSYKDIKIRYKNNIQKFKTIIFTIFLNILQVTFETIEIRIDDYQIIM